MAKQAESIFTGKSVHIPKKLRDEVEEAIQAHLTAVEKLTAVLDKADGDGDLEPNLGYHQYGAPLSAIDCEQDVGDEPENSWTETHGKGSAGGSTRNEEDEPSLAHTNDINQARAQENLKRSWSGWGGSDPDLEAEHDGREPDADDEPNHCQAVMS